MHRFLIALYLSIPMEKELAFFLLLVLTAGLSVRAQNIFNVKRYGAVGDGKTDDSNAFIKAWQDACNATQGVPTIVIPNETFLLQPLQFLGPCKPKNIHFQVLGNIVAPATPKVWNPTCYEGSWITFKKIDGLILDGSGTLDGNGQDWWKRKGRPVGNVPRQCSWPPTALRINRCNNLQLRDLHHLNSPKNHIIINWCVNVTISNLTIIAPGKSPNTDGIDIRASKNVTVDQCFIGTGDDCIAVNSNSSYVNITGIQCGPGHGISIGSLGHDGSTEVVEEIHVKNCTFNGTTNGARIKTWQGGLGYARRISFHDIKCNNTQKPIFIDQFYCPHLPDRCAPKPSAVNVSDVTFSNVLGTSATKDAIIFNCSAAVPCENIITNQIKLTSVDGGGHVCATCINAHGTATATSPEVPCLSS